MGLDADIYFRVTNPLDVSKLLVLPSGYDVHSFHSPWDGQVRPTHEICTCDRYFGPVPVIGGLSGSNVKNDHYTGFWPRICHAIIELLSHTEVTDVWYGSSGGKVGMWPVDALDVAHLTLMYVRTKNPE